MEIATEKSGDQKMIVGAGGIAVFNADTSIQIGELLIRPGDQWNVTNTGTDLIKINHHNTNGANTPVWIGLDGVARFDKKYPITVRTGMDNDTK